MSGGFLSKSSSSLVFNSARSSAASSPKPASLGSSGGDRQQWDIPFSRLEFSEDDLLGTGSFKRVYRGTYLGSVVAIQEVISADPEDFETIQKELRIMETLRHPNVLLFIGVSQNADKFYIVTEFAPKGTLAELLSGSTPLPWRTKIKLALDVTRALFYIHERNVFHRDLKGENVLIFDSLVGKIADFGLSFLSALSDQSNVVNARAKLFDGAKSSKNPLSKKLIKKILEGRESFSPGSKKALASSCVGTVWIRAPEIDSNATYDTASVDIFSLGFIFVELLTNNKAEDVRWEVTYQKRDPETDKAILQFGIDTELLYKILKGSGPEEIVDLAIQCCQEDPEKRPHLEDILRTLDVLGAKLAKTDVVDKHLRARMERNDSQLLVASLMGTESANVWNNISNGMSKKTVRWEKIFGVLHQEFQLILGVEMPPKACEFLMAFAGLPISDHATIESFSKLHHAFSATIETLKIPQLRELMGFGFNPFVTREDALQALSKEHLVVLRLSMTSRGKFSLSYTQGNDALHSTVVIEDTVQVGRGKDARGFDSIKEFLLFLHSRGERYLWDCTSDLVTLADSLSETDRSLFNDSDSGYAKMLSLILFIFFGSCAGTQFVINGGVDAGDCTSSSPGCATLGYALGQVPAGGGDISIGAGAFPQGNLIIQGFTGPLVIRGAGIGSTVLQCSSTQLFELQGAVQFQDMVLDGTSCARAFMATAAGVELTVVRVLMENGFSAALMDESSGSHRTKVNLTDLEARSYTKSGFQTSGRLLCHRCHLHDAGDSLGYPGLQLVGNPLSTAQIRVTDSRFERLKSLDAGGAITCTDGNGATVAISRSTFLENTGVGSGAGIYTGPSCYMSSMEISESCFYDNVALNAGAAVSVRDSIIMTVDSCSFARNSVTQYSSFGGAMYVDDINNFTMTRSDFDGNFCATNQCDAGAVEFHSENGNFTIRECIFANNYAQEHGGAFETYTHSTPPASPYSFTVDTCYFYNNTAGVNTTDGGGKGGAARLHGYGLRSPITFVNSVFSGNSAQLLNGGALSFESSVPNTTLVSISGCTFYGNTANDGGALNVVTSFPSSYNLTVTGNTLDCNTATVEGNDVRCASSNWAMDSNPATRCSTDCNWAGGCPADTPICNSRGIAPAVNVNLPPIACYAGPWRPTAAPTAALTTTPTTSPTATPTTSPTATPTKSPTATPTTSPIATPTTSPTATPTTSPTATPTSASLAPSTSPTTAAPANTTSPTGAPTASPTASLPATIQGTTVIQGDVVVQTPVTLSSDSDLTINGTFGLTPNSQLTQAGTNSITVVGATQLGGALVIDLSGRPVQQGSDISIPIISSPSISGSFDGISLSSVSSLGLLSCDNVTVKANPDPSSTTFSVTVHVDSSGCDPFPVVPVVAGVVGGVFGIAGIVVLILCIKKNRDKKALDIALQRRPF